MVIAKSQIAEKTRGLIKDKAGLTPALERSGLGEVPLANIIYFLRELDKKGQELRMTEFFPDGKTDAGNTGATGNKIRLYLAEDQQIFREAFQAFFQDHPSIELVGASGDTSGESLTEAAILPA